MTVQELKVKISADSENFKNGISTARSAITLFKKEAVKAGKEVTEAFDGLISTDLTPSEPGYDDESDGAAAVTSAAARNSGSSYTDTVRDAFGQGLASGMANTISNIGNSFSGVANVLDLDRNETVIGAVGGGASDNQPVNITTTVELDGDKIGESVNSFNMRRSRVTNGMYD